MSEFGTKQILLGQYNAMRSQIKPHVETRVPQIPGNVIGRQKAVESLTSLTTAEKFREQLKANKEPLSGLYSRSFFDEKLKSTLRRSALDEESIGLILGDVRKFKDYNDTRFGQLGGDHAIKTIGSSVNQFRETDFACRTGGDEMGVILPSIKPHIAESHLSSKQAVATAALHMLQKVHKNPVVFDDGVQMPVHLDTGVTLSTPQDEPKTIYKRADDASKLAKMMFRAGEPKIVFAMPSEGRVRFESAQFNEDGKVVFSPIENAQEMLDARGTK